MIDGSKQQRGRPSVVECGHDSPRARHHCDRADICKFEGKRAGCFKKHHACVRTNERCNLRADSRGEVGNFDTIASQNIVAKAPGGAIGRVDYKEVIA